MRNLAAAHANLHGTAAGNVAFHPAKSTRRLVQVVCPNLLSEPAPVVRRVMDQGRHHGNGLDHLVALPILDLLAVIRNVQRHTFLPGLIPDGDDRVRRAEINAGPAGHAIGSLSVVGQDSDPDTMESGSES